MLKELEGFIEPGSREEELADAIDVTRLPRHVAVIMDGNGRWAKQRNLPRVEGHRAGSKSVRELVEIVLRMGIPYLSLYAFSKENWKRPRREVTTLWRLLEDYLKKEDKLLLDNDIRLKVIGQFQDLPERVKRELKRVMEQTREFKSLTILLALNYSGRAEIVDAVKCLLAEENLDADGLDEETFSRFLYTAPSPDPDLLIRTSGELRISNFLLWQLAYTEIWVTEKYWPDFRKGDFLEAVIAYQHRERRFGDIQPRE
jgi:undecaprenyl diphosphate synthase